MTGKLFDLTGKRAFITGATKGIGYAIANAFVDHGATIVLTSRTLDAVKAVADEINARVGREAAFGMAADLADLPQSLQTYDAAADLLGQIDVLVCNAAALSNTYGPAAKSDASEYARLMNVNIVHNAAMMNHAAVAMKARRDGVILVTTSASGVRPSYGVLPYGVSKAGLNFLVRALGAELAPFNVRVNGVAPGLTRSAAMEETMRRNPAYVEGLKADIPLRRIVEAEEIAAGMVFLASAGGRSMAGQILQIDGGEPGPGVPKDA
ncbi:MULTISPECIES: SDR family NAD(P)-dependent oxidoreductase [unclassified Sphingobium]|uniref:SDR family NAD(P)-dependent oxidoreductase n=1 Tax=unclassified Sphingobium TaxID=2611147 RepID=UPI0035A728A7